MIKLLRKVAASVVHKMTLIATGESDQLWYQLQSRRRGLDLQAVPLEELGLDAARSIYYADSGGPRLRRVLRTVDIPVGSRIVDFGCGKGGTLLTMAEFPFAEVAGVDLSQDLLRVAEANATRAGVADRVSLHHCDAADFVELDRFTHLYFYQPFPAVVLREVMQHLVESARRAPRALTIIYKNPEGHDVIMATGLFSQTRDYQPRKSSPSYDHFRMFFHQPTTSAPRDSAALS